MSVPGDRTTVLYVDDEPGLLDVGKAFLEQTQPFAVDTARSAREALEVLKKKSYDSIVSDYQMPEMDGIEFLKNVRSRYPDLPFILFTGRGREEVVIQAFDAGADYYIQKGGEARSQFRELSHKIGLAVKKRSIERELRNSEQRYRSVVEDQTEFICRFRPDGTHAFVNDAYCRYFGMAKEDLVGHRFSPRIPDPDADLICSHFASLTPQNPVAAIEHRVIMPDGSIRWHHWSDRAIFDESGTLVEYQSVGRDITDRRIAELGLQQRNEELRAAYEQLAAIEEELRSSYDDLAGSQRALEEKEMTLNAVIHESPIPQFVIDRNHRVVYWNHALAEYSGVPSKEVIGTNDQWRAFYPSARPSLADILIDRTPERLPELYGSKYARSALISDAYEVTDFFPRMGSGGKWLHFTAGLIRDRNGSIIGAVESLQDITDQKTAELALSKKNEELGSANEELTAIEEELRSSYDDLAGSQRALEEKEMTLNAVIHESPIPQFVIDRNHRVVYWNHALAEYSGVPAKEVIGTNDQWRAFYPSARPSLADILIDRTPERLPELYGSKYARSTLISDAYEVTDFFPRMGGGGKWLHFTAGFIRDRNGSIIGAVESLQDITDQKTAELALSKKNEELGSAYEELTAIEEELRTNLEELIQGKEALAESERRYRDVVEDQTEFICRFLPDGTHVFVNDSYCRYFGKAREEIIGHRFRPRLMKEDSEKVRALLAALTPDAPVGEIRQRVIMPDGSVRWQRWVDRAIFDARGYLTEYQAVGRDITEIRNAEQALELSEQRYRNVVEDQTELISRFRPDGTHVFVNRAYCRYFGRKPAEIIGSKFVPAMPPEDQERVRKHLASLSPEHPVGSITQRVVLPDGNIRWQQWSDRAIFDPEGRVIEFQSVGRDITGA